MTKRSFRLSAEKRQQLREALGRKPGMEPIPRRRDQLTAPLSFGQERLWFLAQLDSASAAFNIPWPVRLRGRLDVVALARSCRAIVDRHETLQARFREIGGEPRQVFGPSFDLALVDLRALDAERRWPEARRQIREEAQHPFDLDAGPPLRLTLLRLDREEHALLLTAHHIVWDGWSGGLFVHELMAFYGALTGGLPLSLPELGIQYADYAAWQRQRLSGAVMKSHLAYWRDKLAGHPPVLELPADRPRPAARSDRGARLEVTVSSRLLQDLRALSRRSEATLFVTLLATLKVLLWRLTGQQDLLVGSPVAGRGRSETQPLIGFFINTVVLRTRLSGSPTFRRLVGRVKSTVLAALEHQEMPFERLVDELQPQRNLAYTPLFQVMLSLQNAPLRRFVLPDLRIELLPVETRSSPFDCTLGLIEDDDRLQGEWEYSTELFDAATVRRLSRGYLRLLTEVVADPDRRLGDLPLLAPAECQQLLAEWNDAAVGIPRERCVHELFEEQAGRAPEAVAAVCGDAHLTYGGLSCRVELLAAALRRQGVGPEVRVGLCLERSLDVPVALLGILKAGGAYVPLDPGLPAERLAFMADDSGIAVLVSSSDLAARWPLPSVCVVCTDQLDTARNPPPRPVDAGAAPCHLAYVIYTSGSTGRPKGVMIDHHSLLNYAWTAAADYALGPEDRVLQFASVSFDASAEEIYPALIYGATLVLRSAAMIRSSTAFFDACRQERLSVLNLPTAYWHELVSDLDGAGEELAPSTRLVILGGEKAHADRYAAWRRRVDPRVRLINTYGPTEATIVASRWPARQRLSEVPIGRAVANTRLYVVDRQLRPRPLGAAGELGVGGAGLARGYLLRPGLTAERFVPNPWTGGRLYRTGDLVRWRPSGDLEFLGRIDHQVKIRGYRVECGEIEAHLARHPAVRQVAVVLSHETTEPRLVAYVASTDPQPTVRSLRSFLKEQLPDYMIPSAFAWLDELPETPSGKIDRAALRRRAMPAPEGESRWAGAPPRTPVEEILAGIWGEVLESPQVAPGADFFELGGHSLKVTRILSRVRASFGLDLPMRSLFENPTLESFAAMIEAAQRRNHGLAIPPLLALPRPADPPLSFAQQRFWFLHRLDPHSVAYHMLTALRLTGRLDLPALRASLGEVIRRHEILRTTFAEVSAQPVQRIHPPAPPPLPLIDLQGLAAGARDREARRLLWRTSAIPIDLEREVPLRLHILCLAPQEHVVLAILHHIAGDAWSLGILVREMTALYGALRAGRPVPLGELPLQYADYARWQREWLRGKALERLLAYWKRQLAGDLPVLRLTAERRSATLAGGRGARLVLTLPPELTASLKALGRQQGATLFMTLLAGFKVLLQRYTEQDDIAVGSAIAGRNRVETEEMIGCFVNMLVLRTDLSGSPRFTELLQRVRAAALGAYAHQDMPFDRLVEELRPDRDAGQALLFQIAFGLENAQVDDLDLPGLKVEVLPLGHELVRYDLTVWIAETAAGLQVAWTYHSTLFSRADVERMHGHYASLLASAAAQPAARIHTLEMLAAGERQEKNRAQSDKFAKVRRHAVSVSRQGSIPDSPSQSRSS